MSLRRRSDVSEVSFAEFGSEADSADEGPNRKSRASAGVDIKNSEEDALERLVLGDRANFRDQLFRDEFTSGSIATQDAAGLEIVPGEPGTALEHVDDSALFFIDAPAQADSKTLTVSGDIATGISEAGDRPAWEDSDDERLTVSLATATQLRKLRISEAEDLVSGTEYARRLRQQYVRLYPLPSWAKQAGKHTTQRRRRSSASSFSSSGSEMSDSEGQVSSSLPLEQFLRDVSSFTVDGTRTKKKLRPETLDVQRTRDIPDSHKKAVGSLSFHPHYPILLSSSTSSILHLHHVAPTAHPTPNPSLASVQLKGTPIRRSEFLRPEGGEIIFAGRRRFFHSWHLSSGDVKKVAQLQGHQQEHKTTEYFRTSPCGRHMALVATDRAGGGMLNVLSVSTMQWVAQARLDGRGGIADFSWWRNGAGITILGRDGAVAEWSLTTKRTVGTWRDAGSTAGTVVALGGRGGPPELGDDRWVALGSSSGILNIYERSNLIAPPSSSSTPLATGSDVEIKPMPDPSRVFEQLTTSITMANFSPDGQLLAFGSAHKKDALRLAHLPSCTVYRNWPTEKTPLGRVTAVAFSPASDMLAIGNDKGKIRLWEIRA